MKPHTFASILSQFSIIVIPILLMSFGKITLFEALLLQLLGWIIALLIEIGGKIK